MRKTKKVVIRLDGEQHEAFKTAAKAALFSSISEWVRVTLLNSIGGNSGIRRGVGRPELSPEEKVKSKLKRDFQKEEAIRFGEDQGTECTGGGSVGRRDESYQGFKFPFAFCPLCNRSVFGLEQESGEILIRKHKDNVQTLRDIDSLVIGEKRERKKQGV